MKFEPVFIGMSPAGVEWWARKPGDEAIMRKRLAELRARRGGPGPEISAAVRKIRTILHAKSHGEAKSFSLAADGITYSARYKDAIERIAALVREAGGKVILRAKSGKMRKTGAFGFTKPNSITFSLGEKANAFIMSAPEPRGSKILGGRIVR